jgi:hypothetical protein
MALLAAHSWVCWAAIDLEAHRVHRKYAALRPGISAISNDSGHAFVSVPVEVVICMHYELNQRPRPDLSFDVREPWGLHHPPGARADYAFVLSVNDAADWDWPHERIWFDRVSGVAMLKRVRQ